MKQYNFRLDESMISEAEEISKIYGTNLTELVRLGLTKIIEERKNDVYYKLTHGMDETDDVESKQIIKNINSLTKDDLKIVKSEKHEIKRK